MQDPAVVIYLGSICNQNCSYCDRKFVTKIGNQTLQDEEIPTLVEFIKPILQASSEPRVCFHGGEPLLYIQKMEKIIDRLPRDTRISILTNGTLLSSSESFLLKYSSRIEISISYDFLQQNLNRQYEIDIHKTLGLLTKHGVSVTQLQWVIDTRDRNAFSMKNLAHIVEIYSRHKIGRLTLIPLRHIRGGELETVLEDIDLSSFFKGFLQFIQLLYVLKIRTSIDGNAGEATKDYFNDHKQIVLSPDGYIYPEFDFLDYRVKHARIGSWRDGTIKRKQKDKEIELSQSKCHSCNTFSDCGLKYLYKEFNIQPTEKCNTFYLYLEIMIKHLRNLNSTNDLLEVF